MHATIACTQYSKWLETPLAQWMVILKLKDPEPEANRQSGNLLGPVLVEEGKISLTVILN